MLSCLQFSRNVPKNGRTENPISQVIIVRGLLALLELGGTLIFHEVGSAVSLLLEVYLKCILEKG